jgi:hypothetical protein
VLPYAKEVTKSVNVGTPVLAFSPGADVSRRMAQGMSVLLPEGSPARMVDADTGKRRGFLSRMFRPSLRPIES